MSLDKIIFDMQKVFGKESVGAAIDIVQDKGHYSTGSLQLNAKLSGGFPKGLMTEIYGPEGSGKTTACLHAVADAQSKGHGAVYVDFEGSFDKIYGKGLGIDLKKLILIPPTNAEQGLQ
ncbi:MAG: ATPase domain-containing protein, partial [Saprospiraceae bacterium]